MQAVNDYLVVKKDVIEETKSAGGIIIDSLFHHDVDVVKKNLCYAEVLYDNESISFVKKGDRIVMNPQKGTKAAIDFEEYTVITKDQFIAKVDADGKFYVPPHCLLIKIRKRDKDDLYSKWILKDDGTKVQLFIQSEPDEHSDKRSAIFVTTGEILQVGESVSNVEIGDEAILDYTVDNMIDNVLYYDDEENKYCVIEANTTFHTENFWVYASRKQRFDKKRKVWYFVNPNDTLVFKKGDMNDISPLLGVIRNNELIARQPYVFLNHKSAVVDKMSQFGIVYAEKKEVSDRQILSISTESERKYRFKKDQYVTVKELDVFDVQLKNSKIQCILDEDILLGKL